MEVNKNHILNKLLNDTKASCSEFLNEISKIECQVSEIGKVNYYNLLGNLKEFNYIISQHIIENQLELTDICFSDTLNALFSTSVRNKHHKSIVYYVQYGLNGDKVLLTDPCVIHDIFTVKNCLPVMNIVPMQLADNAIKYMPKYSQLVVEARITEKRKSFRLTNLGPKLTQEELDNVIERRGNRGLFAQQNTTGMGLGLYEAFQIVNIHWWLEPTINAQTDFTYEETNTMHQETIDSTTLNNTPLCNFSIFMQFLNNASSNLNMEEIQRWHETELPEIILHNLNQLIYKIIELTRNIEHNIPMINHDYSWRNACYKMNALVNNITVLLNVAILTIFGETDNITEQIVGDNCPLNVTKIVKNTIRNYLNFLYPNKKINIEYTGDIPIISLPRGLYTLLNGIINTILSCCPNNSTLTVEFTSNRYSKQITFYSNDINFKDTFDYDIAEQNNDSILWNKLYLYDLIAEKSNIILDFYPRSLNISVH